MTFDAQGMTFVADMDESAPVASVTRGLFFPQHDAVADPDVNWAASNPDRLMAFLFVTPRDCAAIDAVMAR